jgi:hypothetical protein
MPAGSTYTPIATATGTGSSAIFTFSSIPSTYTDLVIVVSAIGTSNDFGIYGKVNNDSSSLYSSTLIIGSGTSATSQRQTGQTQYIYGGWNIGAGTSTTSQVIIQYLNYANTTTNKTFISRYGVTNNSGANETGAVVGLYRSTSAINRLDISTGAGNWATTATATLYGIASA